MVWSALPATGVQLRTDLMHSHTAHMLQPTMCSPVANLHQVAKLACIMLRNVTPGWIRTPDLDYPGVRFLNMMQVSLATCCKFATGLHIVGYGICAV